jgi:hypothetical protein
MDNTEVLKQRFGSLDNKQLARDLRDEFNEVRDQLEDHLLAINENTTELQANHEFITSVNQKVDKLSERLDAIQMLLEKIIKKEIKHEQNFSVQQLTPQEKRVFMIIYTAEDFLNYSVLAMRLNMIETLVSQYVLNLIEKGVPVEKEYRQGKPYIKLSKDFRDYQAKNNVLNIDQTMLKFS